MQGKMLFFSLLGIEQPAFRVWEKFYARLMLKYEVKTMETSLVELLK